MPFRDDWLALIVINPYGLIETYNGLIVTYRDGHFRSLYVHFSKAGAPGHKSSRDPNCYKRRSDKSARAAPVRITNPVSIGDVAS